MLALICKQNARILNKSEDRKRRMHLHEKCEIVLSSKKGIAVRFKTVSNLCMQKSYWIIHRVAVLSWKWIDSKMHPAHSMTTSYRTLTRLCFLLSLLKLLLIAPLMLNLTGGQPLPRIVCLLFLQKFLFAIELITKVGTQATKLPAVWAMPKINIFLSFQRLLLNQVH